MPKEQLDFNKPEDQEKFEALPEEAKETLVEKAQGEAEDENSILGMEKNIREQDIQFGDRINVFLRNNPTRPVSAAFLRFEGGRLAVNEVGLDEDFYDGDMKGYSADSIDHIEVVRKKERNG